LNRLYECAPKSWKVVELGMGGYPHSPAEWSERDLVALVEAAIRDLTRRIMKTDD
jgi:hypothetical protein